MTQSQQRLLSIFLMTVVLCLAAAVRVTHLDTQSFWYDEGVAFGHSQRGLDELIPRLQDNVHVPAYFGSLAIWEDATGASEFALRYYSVLWSLLSIAGAYLLGKRLFGPVAGIAAALFIALNTFSIYYAQETRMYAMLSAISVLSMLQFVTLLRHASNTQNSASPTANRRLVRHVLLFGLVNALGLYTHISFALVMLAQGILAVLQLLLTGARSLQTAPRDYRVLLRVFVTYSGASLLTIALFSPWIPTAIGQISAQPNISDSVPLDQMVQILQGWLAFGNTYEVALGGMSAVIYFLLLFGLITWPDQGERPIWAMLVPIVWVLVSVGVYLFFGLYERYLRFLLPTQLGFALWLGRGVWIIWQIQPRSADETQLGQLRKRVPQAIAVLTTLAYALALGRGLAPLYNDPSYQRDDYRALLAAVADEAGPNDALIVSAQGLQEIVSYYHNGSIPVYPMPMSADPATDITRLLDEHERIFAIFYGEAEQDPSRSVETALVNLAYPIDSRWFGDPRLLRYAGPLESLEIVATDVSFGEVIALESAIINGTTHEAGEVVRVQLVWTTEAPLEQSLTVFVQLLNDEGVLVAQRDAAPLNGFWPMTLWQVDERFTDQHGLLLPETLPAGDYRLIMGLYDPSAPTERLSVGNGDFLELATLTIE